MIEIALLG